MYGNRQQESEFFVPKVPEQPGDAANNRIEEIRETNDWFLDSVFFYGDRFYQLARRLIDGLTRLHHAVREGKLSPSVARRAAGFAIAFGSVLAAALAHGAVQQRKKAAWEAFRRQAASPLALAGQGYWPQASL